MYRFIAVNGDEATADFALWAVKKLFPGIPGVVVHHRSRPFGHYSEVTDGDLNLLGVVIPNQ